MNSCWIDSLRSWMCVTNFTFYIYNFFYNSSFSIQCHECSRPSTGLLEAWNEFYNKRGLLIYRTLLPERFPPACIYTISSMYPQILGISFLYLCSLYSLYYCSKMWYTVMWLCAYTDSDWHLHSHGLPGVIKSCLIMTLPVLYRYFGIQDSH